MQVINSRAKGWARAGIIISWATFWIILLSPFGLIAWLAILVYLIAKKSPITKYVLLSAWIFVPGCNFVRGTVQYLTGTANLQGLGGPQTYHYIDRETRVPQTSSGCLVVGIEPFLFYTNNLAIRTCTKLFGYQRGSYSGVFPTEEEAFKLIAQGDTITVETKDNFYTIRNRQVAVMLDTLEVQRITRTYYSPQKLDTLIATTLKDECFIFKKLHPDANTKSESVYLADIKGKKLLAEYDRYEGEN